MRVGSARRAAGIRVTRSSGSGEEDDQHSRPLSDPVANPGIKLTFVAAGISKLTETALTLHHALNTTEPFTHANHRLRKGLEYTAKYNLGYEVPFESNGGCPNCTSCKTQDYRWGSGLHSSPRAPAMIVRAGPKVYPGDWCFEAISNRTGHDQMWEMAAAIYGESAPYTQEVVNAGQCERYSPTVHYATAYCDSRG